jgi:mycothiol synthase
MRTTLPPGYTTRMASMKDLLRIHELEDKYYQHHLGIPGFSLERLRNEYNFPGFIVDRSVRLVEDDKGHLVGVAEIWERSIPPVYPFLFAFVDPDLENRGLEDYLLDWAEGRAREALNMVEAGTRVALRVSCSSVIRSAAEANLRAGLKKIRHSYRMRIEMDEPPLPPRWPEGISLRPYHPERDARDVFLVDQEVFRDHFGFVEEPADEGFERFIHHFAGDDSYDPSLWFLAVEGEEIAGICLCRRYSADEQDAGYISSLGVRRPWRRRGIALALLQQAFGEFYRRGKTRVDLGVDGQSLTGAIDLYQKAGMFVLRQFDLYEKELRPGKELGVTDL